MRFSGNDVFSRSTVNSLRALNSLNAASIAVFILDIDLQAFKFFAFEVQPDQSLQLILLGTGFLVATHLINWIGDHISLSTWLSPKDHLAEAINRDPLSVSYPNLARLERACKEKVDGKDTENVGFVVKRIDQIRNNVKTRSRFFCFYVYFWFLAFPVAISLLNAFFICDQLAHG